MTNITKPSIRNILHTYYTQFFLIKNASTYKERLVEYGNHKEQTLVKLGGVKEQVHSEKSHIIKEQQLSQYAL